MAVLGAGHTSQVFDALDQKSLRKSASRRLRQPLLHDVSPLSGGKHTLDSQVETADSKFQQTGSGSVPNNDRCGDAPGPVDRIRRSQGAQIR